MNPGYVYIFTNPSMPGLVKIGRTIRDRRTRGRELYTTGVPTPFELAFEVYSEEHKILEDEIHDKLEDFRVNVNREFFRFPLKDAIKTLDELSTKSKVSDGIFSAISILNTLKDKYSTWLSPDITDVQIVQTDERVWLEITREEEIAGYLKDQIIKRSDLAFIADGDLDNKMFSHKDSVTLNASKFTEQFEPFSIIMTTDLFHEAACHEVDRKYNPHFQTSNNT